MSNEAQQPLDVQLHEARKLWYEKYQAMSGLTTSLTGKDQIPFGAHADLLIKQYQDLINTNQENLNTLVRLLPTLRDYTRIPDVQLTAGQVKALSMLEAWMKTREPYFVLRGYAGTGKEQPVWCNVETQHGPKQIGKLKIGDRIYGRNGQLTTVTGIYPQGMKDSYRVTFRDGTYTHCGLEHLWHVQDKKRGGTEHILTTAELLRRGLTNSAGFKYRVPICDPVDYPKRELPIPPYVLGVLLGDGSFRGHRMYITCATFDLDIIKRVKQLMPGFTFMGRYTSDNCKQYTICDRGTYGNRFTKIIKQLGLWNLYSDEKFIPRMYLLSSIDDRLELLRGLMDTDGTSRGNRIGFSTTSKALVRDITRLVQSLGGLAILGKHIGRTKRQDGSVSNHYGVNIKTFENPFHTKRKAKNWKLSPNNYPVRGIAKIECVGKEEQVCIQVSANDHLYLTDNFIVTHNTYVLSQFAKTVQPEQALYTAPTNKATKVLRTVLPRYRCKTIYSALSLRMVEREDELILEASEEKFNLNGYRVIVVDESSMLNSELMEYINDVHRRFGIKFLFVCDLCQLPPVGEDISPVAELQCPTIELTEVVRHDNQILDVATHIRNAILSGSRVKPIVFDDFSERSVWRLSPQGFYERCQKFAARGYKDTKIIAWRNRRVDDLNAVVREVLYTDEQRRFGTWLENDQIVLTEPVGYGKHMVATTDDEGTITETAISRDPETDLYCYFLGIKMEFGNTINIRAIHEDSVHEFQSRLSDFANQARKPGNGKLWQKFWGLKNRYTGLKHSYALTAHRAQGSTFHNVLVDAGDILANPDRETAKRCLYVGLTRASHRLFMTGFPK